MKIGCPIIVWLIVALLLNTCNIINPEEDLPAIIEIPEVSLKTNENQGANTSNITSVWITVNNQFLGAYPLPAQIPILENGPATIKVEGGIRDNGISSTPEVYPLWGIIEENVELGRGNTILLKPEFSYLNQVKFTMIEDFEGGSLFFNTPRVGAGFEISGDTVLSGAGSGRIVVTEDQPVAEVFTARRFQALQSLSPFVYLEMDYLAEVPVVFGVIGYENIGDANGTIVFEPGFFPNEEWNKIYFNFSPVLAENNFAEVQFIFRAFIPTEGDFAQQKMARVWLDNIKLVHF